MKTSLLKALFILCVTFAAQAADSAGPYKLAPLPYKQGALKPYISEKTMSFHYGKHHKGYVDTLNKLVQEKGLKADSLDDLIVASAEDPDLKTIFNNAAQDWNHTFYWYSMKPHGGGKPHGPIAEMINSTFGSYENFKKQFIEAGTKQFGSGWVWLVIDTDGTLKIVSTGNADLPLVHGQKALLTCDIWEHAYYLDYQNRRKDYVEVFLDHLVNWDFANRNLGK